MRATYLKLVITIFFWGSNFAAGKIALQSFDPYAAAFLRFVCGAIILLVLLYRMHGKFPTLTPQQWGLAGLSGLTGVFLYNALFFSGIQYIPTIRASLIVAFAPVAITLASAVFFGERFTLIKWIGIIVSLLGAMIVVCRGDFSILLSQTAWGLGELLIMGSVLSWTAYTLIGKVALRQMPALTLSAYSAVIGCLLLFAPACRHGLFDALPKASWSAFAVVIYMGIAATALGFVWFYDAVQKIGPAKTAAVGNLTPIFAVAIAVTFLNEELTIVTVIGGTLVIGGILLTNRR